MKTLQDYIDRLNQLNFKEMYNNDFFLTWEKSLIGVSEASVFYKVVTSLWEQLTVRETANMISFMADVIGIRDDMYIGKGNAYMHEVSEAVQAGNKDGVLEQRPTLVNLQCDIDHPTQAMADALHLIH